MTEPAQAVLPALRPGDFLPFRKFFRLWVAANGVRLIVQPKHDELCDELQSAVLWQAGHHYEFIIINIPPRFGKTKIMEALAAWMLAYFPDAQMIYTSYSGERASESSRYIRDTITGEKGNGWYPRMFPRSGIGGIQQADRFETAAGGIVYSSGTAGSLTGFGAGMQRICGGFIVIDDPAKPDDALSVAESERLRNWLEGTLLSRRNSPMTPIIICAQRLAMDDLPGYVLATYPNTKLIKVPAMVNDVSQIPEIRSTTSLLLMRDKAPFHFWSQYQQEPILPGGNLIKISEFGEYHEDPSTIRWQSKVIVNDSALSAKTNADFSVLQCWGRYANKAYLIDQIRGRWEAPELLKNAEIFYRKHSANESSVRRFIIEEAAAGPGLIQSLRRMGIPVHPIKPIKDKVQRVQDILTWITNGFVMIPRDTIAPWVRDFKTECAQFRQDGKSPHDDQVDCLAYGVAETLGRNLSSFDVLTDSQHRG